MNAERKKELRDQYKTRHPEMGVVCWRCGDRCWCMVTKDAKADYNSTSFQLKLGTWPNREMQKLYSEQSDAFVWSVAKTLDYEDIQDDHSDDLQLLLMEFMDEYPDALPMRLGRKG